MTEQRTAFQDDEVTSTDRVLPVLVREVVLERLEEQMPKLREQILRQIVGRDLPDRRTGAVLNGPLLHRIYTSSGFPRDSPVSRWSGSLRRPTLVIRCASTEANTRTPSVPDPAPRIQLPARNGHMCDIVAEGYVVPSTRFTTRAPSVCSNYG